jgi:hypothetical protein
MLANYKAVKQGARNAQEALERVRFCSEILTLPKAAPRRIPRELLPCEKLGWKSNEYVRWLLDGKVITDRRHLIRMESGTWEMRKHHNGKVRSIALGATRSYFEAVKRRDQWLREHGYELTLTDD